MPDTVWSAPHIPMTVEAAQGRIRGQHERLRELLHKAHGVAEHALDGEPAAPDAVASAVGDVHAVFEVHLSFEEHAMPVLLTANPAGAPALAESIRIEHRHQRAMMESLHREAMAAPELPTLAAKLAFLTTALLGDMEEEEALLLG
jgi:hypothetical protein